MKSGNHPQAVLSTADEWNYAEQSMKWYGWGSPVGLGIMLVALSAAAVLTRIALVGL